jgi:hypothetical protein
MLRLPCQKQKLWKRGAEHEGAIEGNQLAFGVMGRNVNVGAKPRDEERQSVCWVLPHY